MTLVPERHAWRPETIVGDRVVLRRHRGENLKAFMRWYSDPEVARLTRYQVGPLTTEEIQRFFYGRIMGADFLAMAIHIRDTDRLIGTCAFSQLDGDNGSALYHITIGERDAWGHGYGTEATELMVAHAFTQAGPAPGGADGLRVQRAGDPRLREVRLQGRGSRPRGDLPRRPLLGRDPHEHPRRGMGGKAEAGLTRWVGRAPAARRPRTEPAS